MTCYGHRSCQPDLYRCTIERLSQAPRQENMPTALCLSWRGTRAGSIHNAVPQQGLFLLKPSFIHATGAASYHLQYLVSFKRSPPLSYPPTSTCDRTLWVFQICSLVPPSVRQSPFLKSRELSWTTNHAPYKEKQVGQGWKVAKNCQTTWESSWA